MVRAPYKDRFFSSHIEDNWNRSVTCHSNYLLSQSIKAVKIYLDVTKPLRIKGSESPRAIGTYGLSEDKEIPIGASDDLMKT